MNVTPILSERAVIEGRKVLASPRIVTSYEFPPIPFRSMDWCAFREGEEEAGNYGWGATEAEAIADLLSIEEGS